MALPLFIRTLPQGENSREGQTLYPLIALADLYIDYVFRREYRTSKKHKQHNTLTAFSCDLCPDNDILAISITNDEEKAYFLIEYAAVPSMGATALFLDTDLDPNTGCTVLVGTEYIMLFLAADLQPPTGVFTLGDNRDCSASGTDFPGAIQFATQGRFVEASVTRESLRALTPSTTGFRIWGETVLNVEASTLEFVFPPAEYIYK